MTLWPLPRKRSAYKHESSIGEEKIGAFLVTNNRVFNGPLGHWLCLFARTTPSAHSLWFTLLALLAHSRTLLTPLTHSIYRLAHALHSLPLWTVEIHKHVFTL